MLCNHRNHRQDLSWQSALDAGWMLQGRYVLSACFLLKEEFLEFS